LHHVGVTASFSNAVRKKLVEELAPLRENALERHPWRGWAEAQAEANEKMQRLPGATSRWNRGKDLSWEALRPERVVEVAYDHMQGDRFRHAAQFVRWRPDKPANDCRYDQLEVTPPYELERVFGARADHGN
jgi:ATP-dependent DNA ligase